MAKRKLIFGLNSRQTCDISDSEDENETCNTDNTAYKRKISEYFVFDAAQNKSM